MKKIISALFLLMLLNVFAFAQKENAANDKSNFNGTWILDKKKSVNAFGTKGFDNYFLVIAFNDGKFKITKVFVVGKQAATYDITLSTDKSGEKNTYTGMDGLIERTSKTHWEKTTLVSEYKLKFENQNDTFGGTERYSLSKDGKKLFLESVQTLPAAPVFVEDLTKSKLVFVLKEAKV